MAFPASPEQGAAAAGGGGDPAEQSGSCLMAVGRRLRQAREARGLASTALADRLRIGVEQLEALEAADRERLPEPVFVIAQARRIAAALQLDLTAELQALRASGELQPRPRPGALPPSPAGPAAAAAPAPARGPGVIAAQTPRHRLAPAGPRLLLAAVVLLLAAWAGWRLLGGAGPVPAGGPDPAPSAAPAGSPGA